MQVPSEAPFFKFLDFAAVIVRATSLLIENNPWRTILGFFPGMSRSFGRLILFASRSSKLNRRFYEPSRTR